MRTKNTPRIAAALFLVSLSSVAAETTTVPLPPARPSGLQKGPHVVSPERPEPLRGQPHRPGVDRSEIIPAAAVNVPLPPARPSEQDFRVPMTVPLPPSRPVDTTCGGLETNSGSYGANIQKREKMMGRSCGNALDRQMEGLKKRLAYCEDLGDGVKGSGKISIRRAVSMFEHIEKRMQAVCGANASYLDASKKLCAKYAATSQLPQDVREAKQAPGAAPLMEHEKEMQRRLMEVNAQFGSNLTEVGKGSLEAKGALEKEMSTIRNGEDSYTLRLLDAYTDNFLRRRISIMEDEAKKGVDKRTASTDIGCSSGEGADCKEAKIRFADKKAIDKFYLNLDRCKRVAYKELPALKARFKSGPHAGVTEALRESQDLSDLLAGRTKKHNDDAARALMSVKHGGVTADYYKRNPEAFAKDLKDGFLKFVRRHSGLFKNYDVYRTSDGRELFLPASDAKFGETPAEESSPATGSAH